MGIASWLSPSRHINGLDYLKEIYGLVAMMLLKIWSYLSSMKE